jgi:hypothetical protein
MAFQRTKILILCKTYPSPSARNIETSCVAGMTTEGRLLRLYPVPFRLLNDQSQFKKWQWIEADIEKARDDHRPESHRIRADTISCLGDPVPTTDSWAARCAQLALIHPFESFTALEQARIEQGVTLGLVPAGSVVGLDITPARHPDWTEEERQKLIQQQVQGDLFADPEAAALRTLRKLPFDFHYRFRAPTEPAGHENRLKIVDWEAGALYWNVSHRHGDNWQTRFRERFENTLPASDLKFLLGTIHRFPDQWLIVSVIYPPKQPQGSLDLG